MRFFRAHMLELRVSPDGLREFERLMDDFMARLAGPEGLTPKAGFDVLRNFVRERKLGLALASAADRSWVEMVSGEHRQHFDCVLAREDVVHSKPAPDLFLKAADLLGQPAVNCLVVGDSEQDIRAAKAASMRCVYVPDMAIVSEEVQSWADAVLPSLAHVKDYLLERVPSSFG